jgi:hypothetical protein
MFNWHIQPLRVDYNEDPNCKSGEFNRALYATETIMMFDHPQEDLPSKAFNKKYKFLLKCIGWGPASTTIVSN